MVWAGVREDFNEPAEEVLTKAFSRIVAIDSRRWIEFLLDIWFDCPLDVHCTYTARQILTAFDDEKVMSFREGVKWLPAKNTNVFFITLNKSDKDYSPTGQCYIHHKERGSKVVICVRELKNDAAGVVPYPLLGLCDFVKYEGSRPMNITWKLERPIPANYLRKTGKLVV